ncbi:MAG: adenylate/guanylate cyclase domain-containing protein [Ramlibacter sp.]|nr:adenylate/guanylate cyclase domain-containing protein [Ramlibacter sp.]
MTGPRIGAWRLRPSIVMLFIVMVVPVFAASLWVGYVSNDRMARDTAQRAVERARLETISQTEALLNPMASLVRVAARVGAAQPGFYRDAQALPSMLEMVAQSPNISSVYVGFADGSYRMALRVPGQFKVFNQAPPAGTRLATRWIDRRAPGVAQDRYTFLSESRAVLGEVGGAAVYDPRARPWFRDAVEHKGLVISNPYIYATTGLPGVTVAMPFYTGDTLVGVVAIDLLLDSLSQYLKTRPASPHSISLVVDNEGLVVAHPDTRQALKRDGATLTRVRLNELADPRPALAVAMRISQQRDQFNFSQGGEEYVAMFSPFPPEFGKAWQVVIVAPLDDFVGEWKANNRKLLLYGLVAIALQVLAIYLLSRRIARPLEQLADQVVEVQNFQPPHTEPVRSPIKEISSLADAVNTLQGAIAAFSAFVPRGLVRQLIGSGQRLELGGRSRFLTIMFTDLESFSAWAEGTPAQQLLERVSAYFEAVTRAVNAESGTIDKFIGDGVMAFWGAPALLEDHAYLACVAALRAQRRMAELNAQWEAQGLNPLHVRIGIHSDAVLVGNMGSSERMSYTVMGDGVNLAARLEGVNKEFGTGICVSHSVYREAGERLWLRRIGVVTVKGRRQDMQVYELLGIKGAGPDLEAPAGVQRLCRLTDQAYEAYERSDWRSAEEQFRAIVEAYPEDRLARVMVLRCHQAAHQITPE